MGDFFRISPPPGFVTAWDSWLSKAMEHLAQNMGDDWETAYLSAPIWRFTLPPNHAGTQAVSGILMASVDRVGRRFPATLMFAHDAHDTALWHFSLSGTFQALEDIALEALDTDADRITIERALSKVFVPPLPQRARLVLPFRGTQDFATALAAEALDEQLQGQALWSCEMESDYRMMSCKNLPNEKEVRGLFDFNAAIWGNRDG